MIACPDPGRLAAAASGEAPEVMAHTRECLRCRALVGDQLEVIAVISCMTQISLPVSRRAALAADVMAASDMIEPAKYRGGRVLVAASAIVAAAIILLVIAGQGPRAGAPLAPTATTTDEPALELAQTARDVRIAPSGVDEVRPTTTARPPEIVSLRDGELSIDTRDREPVTVVAGDTRVTITSSRAKVVARGGVIVTTHVFAGTAEIASGGKVLVIDAGDVWMREAAADDKASNPSASLMAFRAGYEALRLERYAEAIAAFERAADPVVAEDAAFWAAIASERAGDRDDAAVRLKAFIDKFPTSPRIETARSALDRVTQ